MYCVNCQIEIEDHQEPQCPLCGGPLVESSGAASGSAGSISLNLDDDPPAFILDDEEESTQPKEYAAPESMPYDAQAMDYGQTAQPAAAYSAESTTDILDQALEEFDPMVDGHFQTKKTKSKTSLLLAVLLVCVLAAAGYYYYFYMMQEPAVPAPVVATQVVKPRKPAVKPAAPEQQAPADAAVARTEPEPAQPAAQVQEPEAAVAAAETKQQPAELAATAPAEPERPVPQDKNVQEPAAKAAVPAAAELKAAVQEQPTAQEPVPPVAVVEAPAVKPGKPVFSVMTDSCRNQSNATEEMRRLRKLGYDARIMKIDLGRKGVFHRVLIGGWTNRAEARHMADEIRSKLGKWDASIIPVMLP